MANKYIKFKPKPTGVIGIRVEGDQVERWKRISAKINKYRKIIDRSEFSKTISVGLGRMMDEAEAELDKIEDAVNTDVNVNSNGLSLTDR